MKRIFIILLISLVHFCTMGQDANWNHDKGTETDSVYRTALEQLIMEKDSFYGKGPENHEAKILFLEYQNYLSNIPYSVDGYKIQFVGPGNYREVFKKNKNRLSLIKVSPLTLKDGSFRITFTFYSAHLERKKSLDLALSHWIIVHFDFKDGHLVYHRTENGGI